MKGRLILIAFAISLGSCPALYADHFLTLQREFEIRRAELLHESRSQRKTARHEFHCRQDALRIARKQAQHVDCPQARAEQLRQINRDVGNAAVDLGRRNREISRWYQREQEHLRREIEHARRSVRYGEPISYDEPLRRLQTHAPDCRCTDCGRGRITPPAPPGPEAYGPARPRYIAKRQQRHADFDWAGLVLSLLLR